MLPILRLIPVGGVSLAILLLILALNPPNDSPLPAAMMPAYRLLLTRADVPEWRQLLMRAALRPSEELGVLRLLPDTPLHDDPRAPDKAAPQTPEPALDVAGVPGNQDAVGAEDVTGSVVQSPDQSIPVDIGETSSTELPVIPQQEQPPVIMMPERSEPPDQSSNAPPVPLPPPVVIREKPVRRMHRAGVVDNAKPEQFNLLQALFGSFNANRPAGKTGR